MARAAAARTAPRPSAPRRRTAPRRPAPARRPAPVRVAAGRVGSATAGRALSLGVRLVHGPGLIAIVFVLLVGVVFANVALLQRNRQITHDAARVSELKRDNATLRRAVAELGSSERIQQVAAERGLLLPAPDAIRYLRSNPRTDALAAARAVDAGTAVAAPVTPAATYVPPATTTPTSVPTAATPTATAPVATTPTAGYPATGTEIAGTPDAVAGATAGLP